MPHFDHDGLAFHYRTSGDGLPFVFQHGLGANLAQPFGLFTPPPGVRLIAFDCRGHGETRPLGPEDKIGINAFAEDLAALFDHIRADRAVVGGISMGAAVALRFALRRPGRVRGLVLARPAWAIGSRPEHLGVFARIARLIRECGAREGLVRFRQSDDYEEALRLSPAAAESFCGQFQEPRAEEAVARLERIPADGPVEHARELARLTVPVLVLANRRDPIHPYAVAETLAHAIPSAELREITPKSVSVTRHAADVQAGLEEFLGRRFLSAS